MAFTYYKIAAFSGGWHDGEIGVEVVSQSISGNYSVLNLVIRVRETTDASSNNSGGAVEYIQVDGVSKASDDSIDFRSFATGTWYTILTASNVIVYHGTDGKKTISVKGYCATGVGAGTYNQTQSVALPDIARKSTATATPTVDVNGTNQVTATITRADVSFTHKVTFSIGSYSQQYTGVATSQAFAIPLAWLNSIPNAISGTANCRVETFNGAVSLGYVDVPFTITVPATVIPVITDIAFSKVADAFSSNVFVKGISKIHIAGLTVTNQYSATTKSFKAIASSDANTDDYNRISLGFAAEHTDAYDLSILSFSGTGKVIAFARDSRERPSAYYSEAITVYEYIAPTLTVSAFRCNASGVADPAGEYLSATMGVNVSPVNNDNSHIYTLEYKRTIDSTWTPISTAALTGYSGTLNAVRAAASTSTWEVRATVQDKVNTVQKATAVGTKRIPISAGNAGLAVAIGKVAETDGLEIDLATKFNKILTGAGLDLTNIEFSYNSTAAVGTAAKGTFSGNVFLGQIINLILDNGNTAASPTIIIGAVTYSITNMPTAAPIATGAKQTYKLKKTGATTLDFVMYPDYVCEYGTDAGGWVYEKTASGNASCFKDAGSVTIGNSAAVGTGGLYYRRSDGTNGVGLAMVQIFNARPVVMAAFVGGVATIFSPFGYVTGTAPAYTVHAEVLTTTNAASGAAATVSFYAIGKWK